MVREYGVQLIREVNLRAYRIIYVVRPKHIVVLTVREGHQPLPGLPALMKPR
jgi:hypothetical protein